MCPALTGYLCPSASSTDERLDIIRTPGHRGNISATPGYVYGSISRADAVSPVLRKGLVHISSFLPRFHHIIGEFADPVTSLCKQLTDPEFIDTCLDNIVKEACTWWENDRSSPMPQFAMTEDV
jgi:hypothetical protein